MPTQQVSDVLSRSRRRRLDHRVRQPRLFHAVWLDPDRLQSLGLTAGDVVTGPAGTERAGRAPARSNQPPVDQPGAFQLSVRTLGPTLRSRRVQRNIVIKQTT